MAQLLLLAGLLAGFILARRKRFAQHANVQTAMVLLNLALIALFMVPSFYGYVIAGQSVSGTVAQLMIGHGVLGIVVEVFALYLILLMRTKLIPKQFRLGNIKLAMRATLALWTVLVLLGLGIYAERYLVQSTAASAPLLEFRQLGADLYVHAVELEDAQTRGSLPAIKRHAEHLVNLIEGAQGPHYGDIDGNGHLEDPGDGIGLLARLGAVAAVGGGPGATEQAATIQDQLDRIVALGPRPDRRPAGRSDDALGGGDPHPGAPGQRRRGVRASSRQQETPAWSRRHRWQVSPRVRASQSA